jgi:hypothetical protein
MRVRSAKRSAASRSLRVSAAGRQDQVWRVKQNGAETVLKVIPKGHG